VGQVKSLVNDGDQELGDADADGEPDPETLTTPPNQPVSGAKAKKGEGVKKTKAKNSAKTKSEDSEKRIRIVKWDELTHAKQEKLKSMLSSLYFHMLIKLDFVNQEMAQRRTRNTSEPKGPTKYPSRSARGSEGSHFSCQSWAPLADVWLKYVLRISMASLYVPFIARTTRIINCTRTISQPRRTGPRFYSQGCRIHAWFGKART
jgi:hypothetical protein